MHQGHPNGRAADLVQFRGIMQTIEVACSSIQMHANPGDAEATILSLSQSPHPYQACQFILENSCVATARFQAAAAIRDAAIREWGFLASDEKKSLISFCLGFSMKHASSPEGYVQAKVSSVAAQLMKRAWLDFTMVEKEGFFHEVKQAVNGSHGLDIQFTGINFLESLVSEFSPSTSTALGLPREFHEMCKKSLELEYLKAFYCWARDAAVNVTIRIAESASVVPEVKVCSTALRFMLQILNWDFRKNTNSVENAKNRIDVFSFGGREDNNSPKGSDYTLIQPGSSWRDILITSGHIGWLLGLYGALREKFSCEGYWIDCPIAVSAWKLIVQLCSLTGTVFPSDNGNMQRQHIFHLLSGIIQWIDPPDAVSKAIESGTSESELLDGCRALLSIAAVTAPIVFDQLLKPIRPFGTLSLLSALMSEAVKDLTVNHTDEERWSWVARDILLDTWTALLIAAGNTGLKSSIPPEGINAAANLFSLIVESELTAASTSVNNDENEYYYLQASISAMNERLSSYALIARAAIDFSVPLLTRLFSEHFAMLWRGRGTNDAFEIQEKLYSLLLVTGHVLADEGKGETPLVPKAIETNFLEYVEVDKHPVIVLSCTLIGFAEQSLDSDMRAAIFTPRLMEAVIWFLARWSCTYLFPPEEGGTKSSRYNSEPQQSGKDMCSYFGEQTQDKSMLDVIVQIALATLVYFPGEKDLQALTCYQLLHGLVRRRNVCKHLVELDSWCELGRSFANEKVLFSLNAAHQRSLAQTLVLSASGLSSLEASNQYARDLLGPMAAYLVDISGKVDFKNISEQPDVILVVTCMLERLRGAASASEPRTQKAIYEMGVTVMSSILIFLEAYKHESAVVYPLLKLVVHWVEGQIIYLEAQETSLVINFCMRLLQLYSSHNIGKIGLLRPIFCVDLRLVLDSAINGGLIGSSPTAPAFFRRSCVAPAPIVFSSDCKS